MQAGIYDNLKTAVDKILRGKERKFNRKFEQLCSHYLVEPVACTPGAGWEKGQVENQVGTMRKWLFATRPRFASFTELNQWLHDQCINICRKRTHPEAKTRTIWEVFYGRTGQPDPDIVRVLGLFGNRMPGELSTDRSLP